LQARSRELTKRYTGGTDSRPHLRRYSIKAFHGRLSVSRSDARQTAHNHFSKIHSSGIPTSAAPSYHALPRHSRTVFGPERLVLSAQGEGCAL
jgi:hypothetical protein